jgi:hypothetical protein
VKLFPFLKNICIFHLYRSSILKNLCLFSHGRSPIIIRLFWKILIFFTWIDHPLQWDHFEKSLYFSPGQVAHYHETILKNLRIFYLGRSPITMRPFDNFFLYFLPE